MLAYAIDAHLTAAVSQHTQKPSGSCSSSSSTGQDGHVLNSTQDGTECAMLQCIVPAAVVKPLLLTLLQLCGKHEPNLAVMKLCMNAMLTLVRLHCTERDSHAAAAADAGGMTEASWHAFGKGMHLAKAAAAAAAAASGAGMTAEATRHAFTEAADALVHPVLHVLGPAVLNAVVFHTARKSAQELAAISRQRKAAPQLGDDVFGLYGDLLLHVLMNSERVLTQC
jgi:hypothetical protein